MSGMLVLIVGPSGSGKDTLLAGAAAALRDDPRFVFTRRVVTREAAHEDHDTATVEEFLRRQAAGDFALHWEAHGLHYGILESDVAGVAGERIVVANVSRSVVAAAAARYPSCAIEITAPADLRAARLTMRRRESDTDIETRLSRHVELNGVLRFIVMNDGTIEEGVATLLAQLTQFIAAPLPGPARS